MSKLHGTVHVRVTERVTLENLHEIVNNIARLSGCEHCGLLGFDLRLSGDPVEATQIAKLVGVSSVAFSE